MFKFKDMDKILKLRVTIQLSNLQQIRATLLKITIQKSEKKRDYLYNK